MCEKVSEQILFDSVLSQKEELIGVVEAFETIKGKKLRSVLKHSGQTDMGKQQYSTQNHQPKIESYLCRYYTETLFIIMLLT